MSYKKYDASVNRKSKAITKIDKKITDIMQCPKCGRTMEFQERKFPGSTVQLLVCPVCDIRAKVCKKNGSLYLLSTPADSNLRELRGKTHKYFDLIYKNNIMDRKTLYYHMTTKIIGVDSVMHIGEFNEFQCRQCIEISKQILDMNHIKYD